MTETPVFELKRIFKAPPELVWRAWTTPELVARWYGPGVETVIHRFDPKPGGVWLNEMRMSAGSGYQKAEFLEVEPPKRLLFLQMNTDANWEPAANPQMPDWPRVLRTEITFSAATPENTEMVLLWSPHEATEAERRCFAAAIENLGKGWGAGMDILESLLVELAQS